MLEASLKGLRRDFTVRRARLAANLETLSLQHGSYANEHRELIALYDSFLALIAERIEPKEKAMRKDLGGISRYAGGARGFVHCSEAYYGLQQSPGHPVLDVLMVGVYHPEGGTSGEFSVSWLNLKNAGEVMVQLEVTNDAWGILPIFQDVLNWMARLGGRSPSPQEFADALRNLGVTDLTPRERPSGL